MVSETESPEMPKKLFKTDNGLFEIRIKELTLLKFEDDMCSKAMKANPDLRNTLLERWCIYRTKPTDNRKAYSREQFLNAVDEFRNYLFPPSKWTVSA